MHITHEKTYRLEDGSRLRVRVTFAGFYSGKADWHYAVYTCAKGKRTFEDVVDQNAWSFREKSLQERVDYRKKVYLLVAGRRRIEEVAEEAHAMLAPNIF